MSALTRGRAPKGTPPRILGRLAGKQHLFLTGSDQVLSSASNFAIGVLVGRLAGPSAFGAYIFAFTVWLVVLGIHRALVTEPMVISSALDGDRPSVLRRGLEADVLLAAGLGLLVAALGGIFLLAGSGDVGFALIVIAVLLPALIAQDYWRAMAFALHRPGYALVNDTVFVGAQAIALAVVIVAGGRTAPWFILAWGCGGLAGGIAGFFQFRVPVYRRGEGPMFVHTWPFSRWLLADFLTIVAADQTYLLLVAALLGQAAFGNLKAALSLMGPTAVILLTGGNLGLPTLARANARRGVEGLVSVSRRLTRLVGAAVVGYCALVFVAGPWLLQLIYGPEFASAGNLARIGAVTYAVAVACFGAGIAIRVTRQTRRMWTLRLGITALSVAAVVALSAAFGLAGAAWAGTITAAAGTVVTIVVFRGYVASVRRRPAGEGPEVTPDGVASEPEPGISEAGSSEAGGSEAGGSEGPSPDLDAMPWSPAASGAGAAVFDPSVTEAYHAQPSPGTGHAR